MIFIALQYLSCGNSTAQQYLRSDFNNLRITEISNGEEHIIPSYTYTYIIIGLDEENIGIHIFDAENCNDPIILTQFKIVNEPMKENKTIYYTKEGCFLIYAYKKDEVIYQYQSDNLKYEWHFEDVVISSETEYLNFTYTFNFENENEINFSRLSLNSIWYTEEKVRYRCSENFEEPLQYEPDRNAPSNDEYGLMFISKDMLNQFTIFIFDKMKVCKSIMIYYPIENLNEFQKMFDENFSQVSYNKWIENTKNCNYEYSFEKKDEVFIIHIDRI